MHVLITGGTGLIGRRLCAVLLHEGHDITVLSRQSRDRVRQLCGNVEVWSRLETWPASAGVEAVVNLAGEPIINRHWTARRKRVLIDSRVGLTQALVVRLASQRRPPSVLISGSAIGWYGSRADEGLDESASSANDFAARLCQQWELAALQAAAAGTRVCLVRTGLVLDARGGMLAQLLPAARLGLGATLGDGQQWMSWIHAEDEVRAILHLLKTPAACGAFNLTAPSPVRQKDFMKILAATLKRPGFLQVPAAPLRLLLGERSLLLLGGQHVVPSALSKLGFSFLHPELRPALRDLISKTGTG